MHDDSPLIEAIDLWEKITGVSPPDADGFWRTGGGTATWSIRDTWTALKEALDLDPSEITASLLLKAFLEHHLRHAKASMSDLLDAPDEHIETLRQARRLRDILTSEEIVRERDAFIDGIRKAVARYGAGGREDVEKLLAEPDSIAFLRRDALRSITKLRVDQFLSGEPEPAGVTPVFVSDVHMWWNVNSLLAAMTHMPSGVALNMIRDPNAYESYFAFSIRNGGNLFVLSDVPEHAHPLQATMTRKPGRDLDRRASKNWFPYDLLGMELDEKGDSREKQWSDETSVVLYQPDTIPLKALADLPAPELIWATMMLDLIVLQFWSRGWRAKELSYTGEMIRVETALLQHAAAAGLPVIQEQALDMPALGLSDVTGDGLIDSEIGAQHDRPNLWLEERYKHLVVEDTLNLLAGPGEERKLVHDTGEIKRLGKHEDHEHDENGKWVASWGRSDLTAQRTFLVTMSGTKFGTPSELEADRKFLARYNVARQIRHHADAEFESRKDEVLKWFTSRVKANQDALLHWIRSGAVWIDNGRHGGFSRLEDVGGWCYHLKTEEPDKRGFPNEKMDRIVHTFIRYHDLTIPSKQRDLHDLSALWGGIALGGWSSLRGGYKTCALTDAKASHEFTFHPSNAEHLAALAGRRVDQLPDVLQNWRKMKPYRGNSILDRVDPMIWKVSDPWLKLDLKVRLPLSVRGLAQVRKMTPEKPPIAGLVDDADITDHMRELTKFPI